MWESILWMQLIKKYQRNIILGKNKGGGGLGKEKKLYLFECVCVCVHLHTL